MAPPASYTETSLAEFAHTCLGGVAEVLCWSVEAGSYQEVINEVLLILDGPDLATYTSVAQRQTLRALSRREAWRAVMGELASKYRFAADFQSYDRQQMYEMAEKELARAEAACAGLGITTPTHEVHLVPLTFAVDPYRPLVLPSGM